MIPPPAPPSTADAVLYAAVLSMALIATLVVVMAPPAEPMEAAAAGLFARADPACAAASAHAASIQLRSRCEPMSR